MTQTFRRHIAHMLANHAVWIMPRKEWGEAMRSELQAIDDDADALRWAAGCVLAGYREEANAILQTGYARGGLAFLIAFLALREFFAPMLIFAYRMQYRGLAHFLGMGTARHDYRRLIPVMDATPPWLPVLWALAGLLYLVALWRMLRRGNGSVTLFFMAFALDLAGIWAIQSVQMSTGVVITPNPIVRAAGVVLTLVVGFLLWRTTSKNIRPAS